LQEHASDAFKARSVFVIGDDPVLDRTQIAGEVGGISSHSVSDDKLANFSRVSIPVHTVSELGKGLCLLGSAEGLLLPLFPPPALAVY
jgi:hypothetical protein